MSDVILAYRRTKNLGDAIQSVAISRLLSTDLRSIYRDDLPHATAKLDHLLVLNGFLGEAAGTKPNRIVFGGVHIGNNHGGFLKWMAATNVDWVGVRDPWTKELVEDHGLKAKLMGCATLTLPRYDGPRKGTLAVDSIRVADRSLSNTIPANLNWAGQWSLARHRLDELMTAEYVYTTRLHVALACIALGTPVMVTPYDDMQRERVNKQSVTASTFARFTLLDTLAFGAYHPSRERRPVIAAANQYLLYLASLLGRQVTIHDPIYPQPFNY